MKRIHDGRKVTTLENIHGAWDAFSENKHCRKNIRAYERCLDVNLTRVQRLLEEESWMPSPYTEKNVVERKPRKLAKAPIEDHVLEAAAIRPYETSLYDYIAWQCPAVRPNMGQKGLLRALRNELFGNSQEECRYYLSMDAHHYFPLMDHDILKRQISRKVKPGPLQRVLFKVVDSLCRGLRSASRSRRSNQEPSFVGARRIAFWLKEKLILAQERKRNRAAESE